MLNCFTPPHPFSCCSLPLPLATQVFNFFQILLKYLHYEAVPASHHSLPLLILFFPVPTHVPIVTFDLHRTGKWYEYANSSLMLRNVTLLYFSKSKFKNISPQVVGY